MKKKYTIGSITRIGLWIDNENDAWLVIRTKEGWEYGIKKEEVDKWYKEYINTLKEL